MGDAMTYHSARDRLLAAAGYPGPSNVEFFEALSELEQEIRLEERHAIDEQWQKAISGRTNGYIADDECPECRGTGRDGGSSAPCPACLAGARRANG
jgi:hypothetical protein